MRAGRYGVDEPPPSEPGGKVRGRILWIVGLAVLVGVGIAIALRQSPRLNPPTASAVAPLKTPNQAGTEEIFRAKLNQPSDPALEKEYRAINAVGVMRRHPQRDDAT